MTNFTINLAQKKYPILRNNNIFNEKEKIDYLNDKKLIYIQKYKHIVKDIFFINTSTKTDIYHS